MRFRSHASSREKVAPERVAQSCHRDMGRSGRITPDLKVSAACADPRTSRKPQKLSIRWTLRDLPIADSKTKFNAIEDFFLVEFSKAATNLTSQACHGEFPRETPVMAGRLELASVGGILALFRH